MPNITIQVSDDIYHHARAAAASRNMSVSALFRALILTLEKHPNPNQPDGKRFQEYFPALPDPDFREEALRMAGRHHTNLEEHLRRISRY